MIRYKSFLILGSLILLAPPAWSIDPFDTRLLQQPAISAMHVAFVYDNDIWLADIDGSNARRLTAHKGHEWHPRFSPDGRRLVFNGQYQGNTDVYIVDVAGGLPRRLTWHPAADYVQGISPDGRSILFTSDRMTHTQEHRQLFQASLEGGLPTRLPLPFAAKATFSPNQEIIAYVALPEQFRQWKGYRGGSVSRIQLLNLTTGIQKQIAQPPTRCNDTEPMWIEDKLYFLSDRDGEFNLYSYDTTTSQMETLTHYRDFPILHAAAGGGYIIFERAGYLSLFNLETKEVYRLPIAVGADLLERRRRWSQDRKHLDSGAPSPNGDLAAFEYRGEIVTVDAARGTVRTVTRSPGVRELSPTWSPDGNTLAYFSDISGEYELHLTRPGETSVFRTIPLHGAGFYEQPTWSPDGKKLSFVDGSWSLYWVDVESGTQTQVSAAKIYGQRRGLSHSWSPDSRWLTYTQNTDTYYRKILLYSLEQAKSFPVTDGMSDASDPVFDTGGRYLWFLSSAVGGPVRQWFELSMTEVESTRSLNIALLREGDPSPLAHPGARPADTTRRPEGEPLTIDIAGLGHRIVPLPNPSAHYTDLAAGQPGEVFYLQRMRGEQIADQSPTGSLHRFRLGPGSDEILFPNVETFSLSADKTDLMIKLEDSWAFAEASGPIGAKPSKIATERIQVKVHPPDEWQQIFEEAWRINRDYFYDPGMHGCDWSAMREKYRPFLSDLATRGDLNRVIQWMASELGVSHHFVTGGDTLVQRDRVTIGLLGADYEIHDDHYRISKVYGDNGSPDSRGPLTEIGLPVKAGDFLLAVDGRELLSSDNIFELFENQVGQTVRLMISSQADGSDRRTVEVVPIANEAALRKTTWIEHNLAKVHEATGGRVAYIYVPDTSTAGYSSFKRSFYPQATREALILDARHNTGGIVPDYFVDLLRRPLVGYWSTRYGSNLRTPLSSVLGPKTLLIDETTGSGGDLLAWMFRELDIGPLIGQRTWGGLAGNLQFYRLLDGGFVTAPELAFLPEEGPSPENRGVLPDVEVEQLPLETAAGSDPQLEAAIEVVMQLLDEPSAPHQPPRLQPSGGASR